MSIGAYGYTVWVNTCDDFAEFELDSDGTLTIYSVKRENMMTPEKMVYSWDADIRTVILTR